MLDSEEKLIKRARRGDQECFGKLYDLHLSKIYRFILMKVNSREIAEDLVHEVFMNAWKNLGRYRHRGFPFSSWLYQIARNEVIDHYRLKRDHVSIEGVEEETFKVENVVAEELDRALDWQKVRGAITKLTGDQQDVIIMRFVEGLSHREIALALLKTEGAVRIIQHRAIGELKRILR